LVPVWSGNLKFGVVVDHDLEHDRGAGGIEAAHPIRDRHVDAVPVEADSAMG
jgi:hypothetical protein